MRYLTLVLILMMPVVAPAADDGETPPDSSDQGIIIDTTLTDSMLAADTVLAEPLDTVLFHPGQELTAYTLVSDSTNYEGRLTQNPTTALFKSMVLPGWGQFGNRKYLKAALCVGLEVWLISSAIKYGSEASDFYERYEAADSTGDRNNEYSQYLNRKDSRNKYTWFAVIVSFLSMFDAYVDAHLSGFPDRKRFGNVDLELGPDSHGGVQAALTMPF